MVISEAGYVPFLTELTTIDTYGLCDRRLAQTKGTRGSLGLSLHWNMDDPGTRYILARHPDIIVYGPEKEDLGPIWLDRYVRVATVQNRMHIYARKDSTAVDIYMPSSGPGAQTP